MQPININITWHEHHTQIMLMIHSRCEFNMLIYRHPFFTWQCRIGVSHFSKSKPYLLKVAIHSRDQHVRGFPAVVSVRSDPILWWHAPHSLMASTDRREGGGGHFSSLPPSYRELLTSSFRRRTCLSCSRLCLGCHSASGRRAQRPLPIPSAFQTWADLTELQMCCSWLIGQEQLTCGALVTKLVTKCYGSKILGNSRYTDKWYCPCLYSHNGL